MGKATTKLRRRKRIGRTVGVRPLGLGWRRTCDGTRTYHLRLSGTKPLRTRAPVHFQVSCALGAVVAVGVVGLVDATILSGKRARWESHPW